VSAVELVTNSDQLSALVVASLARPDGNMTGMNPFTGELSIKRLELLRAMVPGAARVAVLVNPTNPALETTVRDAEAAARAMGLQTDIVSTSGEIDAAFASYARERPDAVVIYCTVSDSGPGNINNLAMAECMLSTIVNLTVVDRSPARERMVCPPLAAARRRRD
jgi:Flp pilus assembly secretin CpaC